MNARSSSDPKILPQKPPQLSKTQLSNKEQIPGSYKKNLSSNTDGLRQGFDKGTNIQVRNTKQVNNGSQSYKESNKNYRQQASMNISSNIQSSTKPNISSQNHKGSYIQNSSKFCDIPVYSFPLSAHPGPNQPSKPNGSQTQKQKLIKKKTEQHHKKITVFGKDTTQIPKLKYNKNKEEQFKQNASNQINQILNNIKAIGRTKIIYFNIFSVKKAKGQLQEYTISQRQDFNVYIGRLYPNCQYDLLCQLYLHAEISTILSIQHQNTHIITKKQSTQPCLQKLLMGCTNGYVYALDIPLLVNNNKPITYLSDNTIINTYNQKNSQKQQNYKYEGKMHRKITALIEDNQNNNIIYIVVDEKIIKKYFYEIIKNKNTNDNQYDTLTEVYTQIKELPPNCTKNPIKQLKYIDYTHQNGKYHQCLLLFMQGMHMPCILDQKQIALWFPDKLDILLRRFNRIWEEYSTGNHIKAKYLDIYLNINVNKRDFNNDKPISYEDFVSDLQNKQNQPYQILPAYQCPIQGIQVVQYIKNQLIIGCHDGTIHICSVMPTSQYLQQLKSASSQSQPEDTPAFNFFIEPQYAFKQANRVLALGILPSYSYCCVATSARILFIDLLRRRKFSDTLKQKQVSVVNFVKWTLNDNLILCSIGSLEGKVYAYSNELPIRKRNQQQQ